MLRIAITVFILLACFSPGTLADIIVTDDTGAEVRLLHPAKRIISLAPNLTEMLYTAGAGGQIIGTVRYSDYPEAAKDIVRVGDSHNLDIEAIIALDPDLIVLWLSGTGPGTADRLKNLGFTVYLSEADTLEKIPASIHKFGQLAGTETISRRNSVRLMERFNELQKRYAGKQRIRVFYQFWNQPIFTVNGSHLISRIIELCGGENIFADLGALTPQVSEESVLENRPEIIIASGENELPPHWLDMWQRWPEIPAVANGQVFTIPPDLIQRHAPRIFDGADMMCRFIEQTRNQ